MHNPSRFSIYCFCFCALAITQTVKQSQRKKGQLKDKTNVNQTTDNMYRYSCLKSLSILLQSISIGCVFTRDLLKLNLAQLSRLHWPRKYMKTHISGVLLCNMNTIISAVTRQQNRYKSCQYYNFI